MYRKLTYQLIYVFLLCYIIGCGRKPIVKKGQDNTKTVQSSTDNSSIPPSKSNGSKLSGSSPSGGSSHLPGGKIAGSKPGNVSGQGVTPPAGHQPTVPGPLTPSGDERQQLGKGKKGVSTSVKPRLSCKRVAGRNSRGKLLPDEQLLGLLAALKPGMLRLAVAKQPSWQMNGDPKEKSTAQPAEKSKKTASYPVADSEFSTPPKAALTSDESIEGVKQQGVEQGSGQKTLQQLEQTADVVQDSLLSAGNKQVAAGELGAPQNLGGSVSGQGVTQAAGNQPVVSVSGADIQQVAAEELGDSQNLGGGVSGQGVTQAAGNQPVVSVSGVEIQQVAAGELGASQNLAGSVSGQGVTQAAGNQSVVSVSGADIQQVAEEKLDDSQNLGGGVSGQGVTQAAGDQPVVSGPLTPPVDKSQQQLGAVQLDDSQPGGHQDGQQATDWERNGDPKEKSPAQQAKESKQAEEVGSHSVETKVSTSTEAALPPQLGNTSPATPLQSSQGGGDDVADTDQQPKQDLNKDPLTLTTTFVEKWLSLSKAEKGIKSSKNPKFFLPLTPYLPDRGKNQWDKVQEHFQQFDKKSGEAGPFHQDTITQDQKEAVEKIAVLMNAATEMAKAKKNDQTQGLAEILENMIGQLDGDPKNPSSLPIGKIISHIHIFKATLEDSRHHKPKEGSDGSKSKSFQIEEDQAKKMIAYLDALETYLQQLTSGPSSQGSVGR